MRIFNVNGVKRLGSLKGGHKQLQKTSKAPCCYRSSPCNTMNLRSSESSPQIAPLDETIKEMCKVDKVGKVGQRPHPLVVGRRVVLKPGRGRRRVGRRWRRRGAAALRGNKTGGKQMFKRREARQKNYQESRSAKIQLAFPPEKGDVKEDEATTTKNNIVNETPAEEVGS